TALVREDAHRDLPAGPGRTDHHVGRDAYAVEEDLAELGVARHLRERANADARTPHVDEEEADPLVLRRVGLGAAEEEAPVGHLGVARPHLLPGDDEHVAVALGARAKRGEIGSRARLREALAPEIVAGEERAEEAAALRVGPVAEDRGPDQIHVRA